MKFYYSNKDKDAAMVSSPAESLGGWQILQGIPPTLSSDFIPYDSQVFYRCIYAENNLKRSIENLCVTTECIGVDVELGFIVVEPNDCNRYYVTPVSSQYEPPQDVVFDSSLSMRSRLELHITTPLAYKEVLNISVDGESIELAPYPYIDTNVQMTAEWIVKQTKRSTKMNATSQESKKEDGTFVYDKVLFSSSDYNIQLNDLAFSSDGNFQAHTAVLSDAFDDRLFVAETLPAGAVIAIWLKIDYGKYKVLDSCDALFERYKSGVKESKANFYLNFTYE